MTVSAASKLPVCAGFGIRSHEQVEQLQGHVAGVIVGSALVEVLESGQDPAAFLRSLRTELDDLQHKLPGYAMLAVLIGGLSMVSPFSIDTFFPAFHSMEKALKVDAWKLQQVITAYMVPFAFASLMHGPLSDAIGRRPVMIWGMVLYTVGSVACTFAPNYELLIASRMVQGATAGVGVVIGRAIVRDLYSGASAQRLMNLTTMIFGLAPAVAPIIGGWAHVAFGWRAVFAVMVICGIIFLAGFVVETAGDASAGRAHPVQRAQPGGHFVDGAAPPRIPDAGAGRRHQLLLARLLHRLRARHHREALGHERNLVCRAVPAGDHRHPAAER